MKMKRRALVTGIGAAAIAAACTPKTENAGAGANKSQKTFNWKMATTWPIDFPGLGTGATEVARLIERCSGGRINVKVYGSGELVAPFEGFDAVSSGKAEMAHGASYYWNSKIPAAPIFACVPFGMNGQEMNAWLYFGGGWELWKEAYAPYNVLPIPAGNTGAQMGGWFNREIRTRADLKGLKMRIPGLGGEVLRRAGGIPVALSGAEIFKALESGAIDATEWVGPANDLSFGLNKVAKYYYYPGWQEPGATIECIVNKDAFNALPEDLQEIVYAACRSVNDSMMAEYTARNAEALEELVTSHKVQLKPYPDDVLWWLRQLTGEAMKEMSAQDPLFAKVFDSYSKFQQRTTVWMKISEQGYLNTRG